LYLVTNARGLFPHRVSSLSLSLTLVSVRFIRLAAFNQLLIPALAGLTLDLKQLILRRDSLFMHISMIRSLFMPISMIHSLFMPISMIHSLFMPVSMIHSLLMPVSMIHSLFMPVSLIHSLFMPIGMIHSFLMHMRIFYVLLTVHLDTSV
jgi:hypothetical protein